MEVRKRDKTVEKFDFSKIESAVGRAFADTGGEAPDAVLKCLRDKYDESLDTVVDVEEIQDSVEDCLMEYNPKVAKAYIIYRYEHKVIRENKDKLFREISKKLKAEDVQNQNANVDEYSFGGRLGEVTRVVTKDYALKNCMTRKARRNHENNEIYIHDLDSYAIGMHNCLSIPFDDLLANGFVVKHTDVRPANSVDTAMQLVAVIFQLQSLQQFGGVSATHLDWTMVPYVRKSFVKHYRDGLKWIYDVGLPDYKGNVKDISITEWESKNYHKAYEYAMQMTEKEVKQAVEGMYHNLKVFGRHDSNIMNIAA